jgi:hypothetical protein
VLFKNKSQKVDIVFDYKSDQVWSLWGGSGYDMMFTNEYKHVPDLGEIVKKISNYNSV